MKQSPENVISAPCYVGVVVDVPLFGVFDYQWNFDELPRLGESVIVPWGTQPAWAWVWEIRSEPAPGIALERIRPVFSRLTQAPVLDERWRRLIGFAARYYHHPLGACVADALPRVMKYPGKDGTEPAALRKWIKQQQKQKQDDRQPTQPTQPGIDPQCAILPSAPAVASLPSHALTDEQAAAVSTLQALRGFSVTVLHGVTGSGKTEVYLKAIAACVARGEQCLLLLPEINLTPQIEQYLAGRLPGVTLTTLHSALPDGARASRWLDAQAGQVDLLIATRLGVFTPLPRLGLVIVDEEHDPSYKQMEGLKYSARDLSVMLARLANVPVVLGSATPSLETWHRVQRGAYALVELRNRAVTGAVLPQVELIDTRNHRTEHGLTKPVIQAIEQTLAQGMQALVFLNRRGYAPALMCEGCGWVAGCRSCSAHMVWHRADRQLRCHHCGSGSAVPSRCPTCGNPDLSAFGRGTQRIEETLQARFVHARLLRIDADSTRGKAAAQDAFAAAHGQDVDILVGTQMVAKGHDFKRVKLVVALNVDASLFSHQPRAAERLFAQLMQVSGRAGRAGGQGRFLVQTGYPHHALFACLMRQDYVAFAAHELQLREQAGVPPFVHQALLRADHRRLDKAMEFLRSARELALECVSGLSLPPDDFITVCDPVALTVVRVAKIERAQLLVESSSRSALQALLTDWLSQLSARRTAVRWFVDVDPTEI